MHGIPIEQDPPIAFIVIFVIIIFSPFLATVVFAFIRRRNRNRDKSNAQTDKRINALSEWASSRGLSFLAGNDSGIDSRFWFFDRLKLGWNHYGYNIMEGVIGNQKVCAFDYHAEASYANVSTEPASSYTITTAEASTESMKARPFSAVIVETSTYFRPLFIRTEKFRDKIAASAGLEDIDFESAEFNSQFYIRASDRRWAYDAVNQATMDLLLSHCRFNIEFNGKYVVAYRDELFELGHFEEALQLLTGIIDNLPRTLFGKEKGEKLWS
jgi:hypothetical protein